MFLLLAFFIFVSAHYCACEENSALPVAISPAVTRGTASGVCPSAEVIDAHRNATKQEIKDLLQNIMNLALNHYNPPCSCGGPGEWTRIAFLNMTDLTQQCPTNWNLATSPVRACGRSSTGNGGSCDSAIFSSNGKSYTHVCGRINAYQEGTTDAFHPSIIGSPGLEGAYIEGISLTNGAAGSRRHIWSFVSADRETDVADYNLIRMYNCPCTNINVSWPYQIPSFIGNNYFCDTGNPGPTFSYSAVYSDDPLWDGQGCGSTSTCCEVNNPPWFCTTLPQPTSDDIELRICADSTDEDILVNLIDINII